MILTVLVALTYPVVIQYKRGGLWNILYPLAFIVLLLDIIASYTEWSIVFGAPNKGDHTITQRISSMHEDVLPARRQLAHLIQVYLDACEPDGEH